MDNDPILHMLSIKDFEEGAVPKSIFSIRFEQFVVDGETFNDVLLDVNYDTHGSLQFKCVKPAKLEDLTFSPTNFFRSIPDNVQGFCQGRQYDFIAITPWRNIDEKLELNLILATDALTATVDECSFTLEAIILNGPKMIKPPSKFRCDGFVITLSEFASTKENRKNKSLKKSSVPTGYINIAHEDGTSFKSELGIEVIHKFYLFLTFVRGAHCGIGHIIGQNDKKKFTYANLGFTRCDQLSVAPGWYDNMVEFELPQIFEKFSKLIPQIDINNPLYIALEYYRASNIIRESSIEMGVVASYAALETLVPHLLETKAGWSKTKLNKGSFHKKLRAAVAFIDTSADPFEHDDELRNRTIVNANIDAYEIISKFRNRLVHQGEPFTYIGRELLGVWNLSQWLVELFLFYWLGHRGKMADRRDITRCGYQLVDVPLPK